MNEGEEKTHLVKKGMK